jgi:iron-sulfur cluster assembly protein
MITLTPGAARQIRLSAGAAQDAPVTLRVAARSGADGSIEFGMGFDEPRDGDVELALEGITVLVAKPSRDLLARTVIDYLEVEPGEFRFVFARAEEP